MNKQFNFMHLIIFNIRNNWALILSSSEIRYKKTGLIKPGQ